MYRAFISSTSDMSSVKECFYDSASPLSDIVLITPKITLEDNAAGSFEFSINKNNIVYNKLEPLKSIITVTYNNNVIWDGRVTEVNRSFNYDKTVFAEGSFAFFNDSIQPYAVYNRINLRQYVSILLNNHNEQCEESKRFYIGNILVNQNEIKYNMVIEYQTTMDALTKLTEEYGGHFMIRRNKEGVRFLDYLPTYPRKSKQRIEFGSNLLDFSEKFDMTDFCTVATPIGASLKDEQGNDLEIKATCSSANNGVPYVVSDEAVREFGWINKIVEYNEITDPLVLKNNALEYLRETQFRNLTIDIKATDLSYKNNYVKFIPKRDLYDVFKDSNGSFFYTKDNNAFAVQAKTK